MSGTFVLSAGYYDAYYSKAQKVRRIVAEKTKQTLEEYDPILNAALARNLPLVCANADKQVIYGQDRVLCAGLLAELYENSGGRVQLHGKPDPLMYRRAHALAQQQLDKTIEKNNPKADMKQSAARCMSLQD